VVFVQQMNGGVRSEIRLCSECAKERGLDKDGDLAQSLAKLIASLPAPKTQAAAAPASCPACGTSFEDIKKNAVAGCPSCWESFGAELLRKQYKDSGKRKHRGRLPARMEALRAREDELKAVKLRLSRAVAAEDYETAARCRDRILELEGENGAHA